MKLSRTILTSCALLIAAMFSTVAAHADPARIAEPAAALEGFDQASFEATAVFELIAPDVLGVHSATNAPATELHIKKPLEKTTARHEGHNGAEILSFEIALKNPAIFYEVGWQRHA